VAAVRLTLAAVRLTLAVVRLTLAAVRLTLAVVRLTLAAVRLALAVVRLTRTVVCLCRTGRHLFMEARLLPGKGKFLDRTSLRGIRSARRFSEHRAARLPLVTTEA
jgi:hypothetical protein